MSKKMILDQYTSPEGILVTVLRAAAPRKEEKTFRNNKFSIYNQGRQACLLGRRGHFSSVAK